MPITVHGHRGMRGRYSPAPAPSWFTAIDDGTWSLIDSGTTLETAVGSSANAVAMLADWTGMAIDQTNRKVYMIANGGHSSYAGNEGYQLDLTATSPGWVQMNDPTPTESLADSHPANHTYVAAVNKDGRSQSMHTAGYPAFANGRVWIPFCCARHYNGGANSWVGASFGVSDALADPDWGNDAGSWAFHGCPVETNGSYTETSGYVDFSGACFDSTTGKLWLLGRRDQGGSGNWLWSLDTSNGAAATCASATHTSFSAGGSTTPIDAWRVCCPDLGINVWAMRGSATLYVQEIATGDWATRTATNSIDWDGDGVFSEDSGIGTITNGNFAPCYGAGYRQATHRILLGNSLANGGRIFQIQVPVTGGVWDDSVENWTVSEPYAGATANAVTSDLPAQSSRADYYEYNKWAVIDDMGDGRGAVICVNNHDSGFWIFAIPEGD